MCARWPWVKSASRGHAHAEHATTRKLGGQHTTSASSHHASLTLQCCARCRIRRYTAYALDLLGFGDSDKPEPAAEAVPHGHLYNYNTWSQQVQDFVQQVSSRGGAGSAAGTV